MYDVALWTYYSVTVFSNSGLPITGVLTGCLVVQAARESKFISGILQQLGLPTADTIVCLILVFCLQVIARFHAVRSFSVVC